jgi:hypothetical protein
MEGFICLDVFFYVGEIGISSCSNDLRMTQGRHWIYSEGDRGAGVVTTISNSKV